MQVVEVFSVNQKHQHVEPLPADLESHFDPIHLGKLEKLGAAKSFEQTSFLLGDRLLLVEFI